MMLWQALILFFAFLPVSQAASVVLFDGSGIPEDQGWSVFSSTGPEPVITTQTGGGLSDLFSVETAGRRIHKYRYDAGSSALLTSIRVAVADASHNFADAGFYFSVIHSNGEWMPDRANSIYIDSDEIGFMNSGLSSEESWTYSLDATEFHEYVIRYSSTHLLELFVDAQFSDIESGIVTPVLIRQMYEDQSFPGLGPNYWDNHHVGSISFGDMTNDLNVNSSYEVDFVRYENLGELEERPPSEAPPGAVPAPSAIWLFGSGLAGIGYQQLRKNKAG